jgi:hypothetical protein
MGQHPFDVSETEPGQAITEQQEQLSPRFPIRSAQGRPAFPLPHYHSP